MSFKVIASKGRHKVVAFNAIQQGIGPSGASMSTAALLGTNLKSGLLEGIIEESSNQEIQAIYRDIYFHDPIAGAAVDLKANLPWSDFNLIGATEDQLKVFMDTIERLNLKTLHVEMSTDQMVSGAFLGSLVYKNGGFSDVIPFDYAYAKVTPNPLYSEDPVIQVEVSPELKSFVNSNIPAVKEIHSRLPQDIMTALRTAKEIDLDPLSTIYLPRTSLSTIQTGVSYFRRILPLYLIERVLYRGTLSEVTRRQRSTLHITAGDEDWIPTSEELSEIVGLFQSTEMDPISSVVATRNSIQTQEIRSAGDFFKWTDVADQLSFMKMRALGINESFLSGDASYNCVSGDTLIPTENGLLRIDQLCNENDGSIQEIKVKVGSITKPDYARSWHYNGVKPTLTVKTKQGNAVTGTPKHPLLVLNESGELQWKPLSQMNIGDMLCINPRSITRTKKLAVNVKYKGHTIKYMTPDLAFLLGALLSDGHVTKDGTAVRFGNTNERFFDRVVELVSSLFDGVHHSRNDIKAGTETRLKGSIRNKDCRVAVWSSKDLVSALNDLGLVFTRTEKTQSTTLNVPWSIMQADKESQCAFLAGFIEGDGNVNAKLGEISIHSSSENCLSQIQAILNSHGHLVTKTLKGLTINKIDALALWEDIKEYMVSKDIGSHNTRWRYNYGVPQQWFLDILSERKVRSDTRGTIYLDDEGNEVKVSLNGLWSCKALGGPIFSYDKYEQGLYKEAFALLSRISKKAVDKLKRLLSLRYHYTPIVSIEDSGLQKVYDLSMNSPLNVVLKGGDTFRFPSFIVNGLVGSNTMEVAMSTFIEDLRTYRERETRRLYYDKLFPLIAVANNFYKEENKTTATRLQTTRLMKTLNDTNNLVIPEVHWHKPLQPEADQSYMEILSTLEDKGLPVPLRMWAAAGGYNLDKILADQEADADISKKVEEYKKVVNSNTEEASLRAMAGLRPQHFLNRDYGEAQEIVGYTVTGKKKYIHNQKLANEKMNMAAAKALTNLADPNKFQDALKRGKK